MNNSDGTLGLRDPFSFATCHAANWSNRLRLQATPADTLAAVVGDAGRLIGAAA